MHGFRNAIEGQILQIPGSSVRLDAQSDVLWFGFNVRFGGRRRRDPVNGFSPSAMDPAGFSGPATGSSSQAPLPYSNSSSAAGIVPDANADNGVIATASSQAEIR
jgi:hypothetical protein